MSRLRPRWESKSVAPALAVVVLALVCFARLVALPSGLIVDGRRPSVDHANLGEPRPIGNDLTFLFLPHHLSITRVISQYGHLPLWDARGFGGRPLVGNPQGGIFYPPVWAVWWSGSYSALGWLTIGHLLWGSLGVYILMRSAAQGRLAATVAAAVYQASPLLLAQVFEGHYPHVWAACWYPWAFWCYAQARAGRTLGLVLLALVLALTYLAGHPQEWLLLVVALSAWCLADAAICWRAQCLRWAAGKLLVGAGVLAFSVGLAAVDVTPQLAVRPWLLHGQGLTSGDAIPRRYHLGLLNGFQLLSPSALGGPADYFGNDNYWETVFSIGFVPFFLAVVAVLRHPERRLVRGWLVLVGLAVWFACGPHLGFYTVLYHVVPGMSWFRVPARSLFLANLGAAVLAGLGMQTLISVMGSPSAWRRFALGAALVLAILLAALCAIDRAIGADPDSRTVRAARRVIHDDGFRLTLGAMAAILLIGSFRSSKTSRSAPTPGPPHPSPLPGGARGESGKRRGFFSSRRPVGERVAEGRVRGLPVGQSNQSLFESALIVSEKSRFSSRYPKLASGLIGLLAIAELGFHGHSLIQVAPASQFLGSDPVSESLHRLRSDRPSSGMLRIKVRDSFYGDLRAIDQGFEKTNVNDVFQLDHAARLYETLYPVASRRRRVRDQPMNQAVQEFQREVRQAVFDRMSVEYLVSDRVENDPGWPVAAEGSSNGSHFVIERNPSALPRAYVVPHAAIVHEGEPFTPAHFRRSDPHVSVVMNVDPLRELPPGPRQPFTRAEWKSTDPDHPVLVVTTDFPGLLVVTDTWMPGWTAKVDGATAPILRGNHAQRVVPLPRPGQHSIALDYRPPGFAAGCVVTACSAVAWVIACGFVAISGRKAGRPPDEETRAGRSRGPIALRMVSAIGTGA